MASAKFLEEALSTDVDESAVNALVGSLETQLVTASPAAGAQANATAGVGQNHVNSAISNGGTVVPPSSTQKHGVTNGGAGEAVNTLLLNNTDANKSSLVTSSLHQQSGNLVSSSVVNTASVVTPLQGAVPASGYINQVQTTTSVSQPQHNLTPITNKHHEPVKILYPNNQTLTNTSASNIINNSRVTFPAGTLPNGNINLVPSLGQNQQQQTVLTTNTSSVQSVVSQSVSNVNAKHLGSSIISGNMVEVGKQQQQPAPPGTPQGPTLLLKTPTNNPSGTSTVVVTSSQQIQGTPLTGMVTVPITTMAALAGVSHANSPGVVTLAKNIAGGGQAVVGSHPGATTILPANVQILNVNAVRPGGPGQAGQKGMTNRVVIGAPHMVGARPGQPGHITLQALQGLQPGTQGHLLLKTENGQYQLLRVGPAPTTPAAAAITPTGSPATATTGLPTTTYRLQSVPATAGPRAGTPMQPTLVTAGTTTTSPLVAQQATAVVQNAAAQRQAVDSTKEKCRKFLANLLELSSREPKQVEKNVRTLIQELIDAKVEPEEFCDRLERLLNASPQPCLIGFLKKSLPLLRQALITKELVIEGIRPPPHTVVFSLAASGAMVPQLQARGTIQQQHLRPTQPMSTQVRVMSPVVSSPGMGGVVPRAPHTTIQHRLVTPGVRPHLVPTVQNKVVTQMSAVSTAASSTVATTTVMSPAPLTMVAMRQQTPTTVSSTPKSTVTPRETKEKKNFSSSGYTGDDDINDVAAMGGVNLAEETQRILGSTEFVGTQIRSCKDEMFLQSTTLHYKIRQILTKHGLDDPSTSEVAAMVSHATQERLKNLVEKLAVIAEHRLDLVKLDPRYEVVQDVKAQLRFLEELDRLERRRHEEQERELLLRAAKSRSKSEDPEQAKLKAKAKEMQRAEMEELRQREANLTALQAIGPRKKPRLELGGSPSTSGQSSSAGPSGSSSNPSRSSMPLRPRVKRVNLRDLLFLLEQEKETCRTPFLYKAYLK